MTDPSTPEGGRRQLAHGVLDGRVGELAVDVVAEAAAMRWAGGRTLAAALDRQAVRAELMQADENGDLDETEDELFRFARTVESNPDLRDALADRAVDRAGRQLLVANLLTGKATDSTVRLAQRAVAARERTFAHTIEGYVTQAAAHKNRVVATVRVAQPLTGEQAERLKAALTRQVGREVAIQVIVDEQRGRWRQCRTRPRGDRGNRGRTSGRRATALLLSERTCVSSSNEITRAGTIVAELTIQPEDIRQALDQFVRDYQPDTSTREEVGTVVTSGDGIARVEGLPSAMANELLEFENGTLGIALNLDVREIGVVVMGDSEGIEEGQVVKRTGDILSVPVGEGYLGRTVDALGRPIDGLGDITDVDERRPLELQAAGVMDRQEVRQPLQTGIKAIDAMIPIGRGQRQLIIGDRKTGKSAIAVDTIINQRQFWESGDPEQQVRCIYVAIGQKGSTVAALRGVLEEAGALAYTTIVHAPASDPAGYKYVAPYTGSAIGQHWMYAGKHVLIVFDDLTKQAEAYRAMSLLLRRPPGREAYPGDVFYLHSRLLERCAKLSDELGAGSMTGLPIIETKANDVSAYIPTNVISITDGQIFLQSDLFNANQRPAIDVGVSVSRVGGAAQIKAMKNVSGSLKINLAQYRDMQAFAMFASDLDATSRRQLDRGARLVELLRQPQYTPYPVEEQVVSVWAGINGQLDEVPVDDVLRFEQELLEYLRHNGDVLNNIKETKSFDDDSAEALKKQIAEFKKGFQTGSGKLLAGREEHEALPSEDVAQEQIVKQKRG